MSPREPGKGASRTQSFAGQSINPPHDGSVLQVASQMAACSQRGEAFSVLGSEGLSSRHGAGARVLVLEFSRLSGSPAGKLTRLHLAGGRAVGTGSGLGASVVLHVVSHAPGG